MNPKSKEGGASGVPLIGTGFHGDPTTRGKMFPTWECGKTTRSFIFPSKLKLANGLASYYKPSVPSLKGRFAGTLGQFYGLLVRVSTAGTSPEGPFTGTFPRLESPSTRVSTWVGLEGLPGADRLNRVFILTCSSARRSVRKL